MKILLKFQRSLTNTFLKSKVMKIGEGNMCKCKNLSRILQIPLFIFIVFNGVSSGYSGTAVEPAPQSNRMVESELTEIDMNEIALKAVLSISSAPWFRSSIKRKKMWILLSEMQNDTDEHIDGLIIIEKIQALLIKNHKVRILDSGLLKEYIKKRNMQERELFQPEKAAEAGKFFRAEYVLKTRISNIKRQIGFNQQITYFFAFHVVHTQSRRVHWSEQIQIIKMKERQMYRE